MPVKYQPSISLLTLMTFLIGIHHSIQVPFPVENKNNNKNNDIQTGEGPAQSASWPSTIAHNNNKNNNSTDVSRRLPETVITELRDICKNFDIATKGCECEWGKCLADRPSPACRCPWGMCFLYRPDYCEMEKNITQAIEIPSVERMSGDPNNACGGLGYAEPDCICSWGKCQSVRSNPLCACPWGRCMEDRPAYCQQSQLPCITSYPKFDVPQKKECACAWGNCQTERPTSACACPWGDCTTPRDREKCRDIREEKSKERKTSFVDKDNMTEWVMYGLSSLLIILILSIVGFCLYQTRRRQRLPILQYTIEDFTVPADGRFLHGGGGHHGGDVSCDCLIEEKAPSVYSTTGSLPSTSTDVDTDITDAVIDRENEEDDDDDDDDSLRKFGNLTPNQDLKIFEDSNFERKRKGSRD